MAQMRDVIGDGLFPHLFEEAEKVRWQMSDFDWDGIDRSVITPAWVALVREAALGELTTFNATERFFKDFGEDVDFTQWLSVWLYEETKHPFVMMRWLHTFGETFTSQSVLKGRETFPFMPSTIGTLATNIFSEVTASSIYLTLRAHAPEPVLQKVASRLAADEARHASHFYAFTKRQLSAIPDNTPEKAKALQHVLRVLYFWLETDRVTHPVNLIMQRLTDPQFRDCIGPDAWHQTVRKAQARMLSISSTLLGRELRSISDVSNAL